MATATAFRKARTTSTLPIEERTSIREVRLLHRGQGEFGPQPGDLVRVAGRAYRVIQADPDGPAGYVHVENL